LTENLEDIEQRRNYEAIRMHFNEWRK